MRQHMTVSLLASGILTLALLLAGCDQGTPTPPKTGASGGKPRIALVMKSLANEFFKTMEDGAKAHQATHAGQYDLLANGIKDEKDVARQIDLVKQMIAQKVDAIVLAPADSKALVAAAKEALDAGIVVVNIDNRFDADALADKKVKIPFVGPDNRAGAKLAGECLARTLKAGDEVALIEGAPNAYNAIQRKLGFEDACSAAGLKIVTSQTGQWQTEDANKVVGAILPAQPNLKAILCANDSMALGAVAALRSANKLGQVTVIGFDNINAVQELMKKGEMLCTVDQHADQIAVFGIQYALEILKTKAAPADKQTPVELVTKDGVK